MCPPGTTVAIPFVFCFIPLGGHGEGVREGRVLIYFPKIHISIFLVPDDLEHLSSSQTEEVLYVR